MTSRDADNLSFPSGVVVTLPAPVFRVIEDRTQLYVILETAPPDTMTDNVLCFTRDGIMRWRIEDIIPQQPCSFGEGRIRRDGTLGFYNTDGVWIAVDKDTGTALGFRIERMGPLGESESQRFEEIFWRS